MTDHSINDNRYVYNIYECIMPCNFAKLDKNFSLRPLHPLKKLPHQIGVCPPNVPSITTLTTVPVMVAKTRPDKRRLFFLLRVASRLLGSTIWLVLLCCVPPVKPWYSWGCSPEAAPTAPSTISARRFIVSPRGSGPIPSISHGDGGCRQGGL